MASSVCLLSFDLDLGILGSRAGRSDFLLPAELGRAMPGPGSASSEPRPLPAA